jgi:hypothetical protein
MADDVRPWLELEDDGSNVLRATWSRSGKRLILSVAPRGSWDQAAQAELTPEQAEALRLFLGQVDAATDR